MIFFIYIPVILLHKYRIWKTCQGDSATYNWKSIKHKAKRNWI